MKPSQIVTGVLRFHTQGCKRNLDDGRGCSEIFQSTAVFSGVKPGVGVALPETGLYQVKVSHPVVERGSLDLVIILQGFSGQRIN